MMNEWEVERVANRFDPTDTPNLVYLAFQLMNLVKWTNSRSDGWMYWPKPSAAAKRLMALLEQKQRDQREDGCVVRAGTREVVEFTDATDAEVKAVLKPIKAFLTRQGAEHGDVLEPFPIPEPEDLPVVSWTVHGTSMVIEAATEEEAIERAEQSSGWHWEAVRA